jgi:TolB-like protein
MSFFDELKRRNVVRVGIAYVVIGWALAQVAEFAVDNFHAPEWTLQIFVIFLLLGLPLVLFLSWAFEMTPEGLKREEDVDRSQSITAQTGRKLDRIIIGVMAIAIVILLTDKFILVDEPEIPVVSSDATEAAGTEFVATGQSIAVLPFVNMSDDKDYFADGLSEELLNLLAKIPNLKVAGRTSSFAFKGRNEDFQAIGDALKVAHVLEGSVRRSGDQLRVTAQLIKVSDGYHLWSETYDRKMEDIFAIQDDVAGAITSELRLRLAPATDRPTKNTDAYALYLQAVAMSDFPDGVITEAIALLDQAIALDPNFAKAYELKALSYWAGGGWTIDSPIAQPMVYENAMKALEIDPTLVAARSFSVSADPNNWSWAREINAIEEAVKATPNDIRVLDSLTYDLTQTGYFSEALALARRMIELDPLSSLPYGRAGHALSALGRDEEARVNWRREAELSEYSWNYFELLARLAAGEFESAIDGFEKLYPELGLDPGDVRLFVESASNPETGREFLKNWVEGEKAGALSVLDMNKAQFLYLGFGYLDDYWREIEETTAKSSVSWSDADSLEHLCRVLAATGCAVHPAAIPYAKQQGMTDLWDQRGPPDRCSKIDGEWVCE